MGESQFRNWHRGFTLLELLVVMVAIGLLAGFVAPKYFARVGKTETRSAQAQIQAIKHVLEQYRLDTGRFPATGAGLAALTSGPLGAKKWTGPYLEKAAPLVLWGRLYAYKSPGDHGDVDLASYGNNGQPGDSGESADVTT